MHTTIRTRFLTLFITLILFPLITIGFILSIIYHSKIENLALKEQDIILQSLNDDVINNQVKDIENLIIALSENENLYNIFEDKNELEDIKDLWSVSKAIFPEISWIYYGSNSGEMFSIPYWYKPPEYDLVTRPWFITGKNSSVVKWTIPYPEYGNGDLILSTTIGIKDKENNYTGVLSIDTAIKDFFSLLENEIRNKETEIVIITLEGLTVSLKDKSLALDTKFNWYDFIYQNDSKNIITIDDKDYYFKKIFNPKLNIYLVSLMSKTLVDNDVFQVLIVIIILMVFGLISIISAGMLISKDIIDKIIHSQDYIAQIAKGNYSHKKLESNYNEFTTLNRNIQKLAYTISSQIEEFEVINTNLDESLRAQEKLVELRTSLIHLLSHNSASPITFLYNITFSMLENDKCNNEIKMIHSAVRTLKSLNDNIMTFLKLDEGINSEIEEVIDLHDLSKMIINNYSLKCAEKNIQIVFDNTNNVVINNNYFIIKMIIENLINNAVKYSFKNTTINIRIWSENGYGYWRIEDGGPGFTDEDCNLMFDKFQTLSARPTDGESSTGLGLFLVKELSKHAGIDVSLSHNERATFILKIKL